MRAVELTPKTALTGTRDLAVEYSRDLLVRFGWQGATVEMLTGMQEEIFGIAQ